MRFIAIPNYTPHRIAFGLTPSALRLPLKGGVIFKLSSIGKPSLPGRVSRAKKETARSPGNSFTRPGEGGSPFFSFAIHAKYGV